MPFLGNTPANTFVSIAKQTITGNGGTSYSLSYAVTSANDIDVFYNNVRQEPGVAYTANGTTITFTEAIQSTDSVYILFNGQAVGTIDAPAGAYLPTTGGTINGQVNVNNRVVIQQDSIGNGNNRLTFRGQPGSSYRWNIDNNASSNTLRIFRENDSDGSSGIVVAQFDSAGRLSLPQQPSFKVGLNTSTTFSSTAIVFNSVSHNVGSCYSTSSGKFTAPVSGAYHFSVTLLLQGLGDGFGAIEPQVRVNSGYVALIGRDYYRSSYTGDSGYKSEHMSVTVYLNQNDYVDIYSPHNVVYHGNANWTHFSGFFVG